MNKTYPIGVYDSGVGGLTVWREIVKLLPNEDIIYFADNKNCPYGQKQEQEIINISEKLVGILLKMNCKIIVVACNTATAAAIEHLRAKYKIKFVGMEPAVKPAAINSRTGKIGVLATQGTIKGNLFNQTSKKYAKNKDVHIQIGYGLVDIVENGEIHSVESVKLLKKYILPMLENNVDQIVLGCTHYPFLIDEIKKIVGERSEVIDPSGAVAKQVENLLQVDNLLNTNLSRIPKYTFYASGSSDSLKNVLKNIGYKNFDVKQLR